jgi:pyruvate dehydrogenase E1 component alpha subunit
VWKLPVVWVCENNGWAVSAPFSEQSPTENIADRAVAYGVPGVVVDGQDALAVHAVVSEAVARARAGGGPTLVEAKTLRIGGHYEGDRQTYRDDLVEAGHIPRDPLELLRAHVPPGDAARLDRAASDEADSVLAATLEADRPEPSIIFEDVWT